MFAILLGLIVSCEKDDIQNNINPKESKSIITTDAKVDSEVSNKIKAFSLKMKDKDRTKDDIEFMAPDDMIWNMEALLNYDYADMTAAFPNLLCDTITFYVPVGTEGISITDIQNLYGGLINELLNMEEQIPGYNKAIWGIDLILDGSNLGQEPSIKVNMIPYMGFCVGSAFSTDDNDYWYWGFKGGKLNGQYNGQYDATDALTFAATNALYDAFDFGDYYFTDIESTPIIYPFEVPYSSQYGNYRLYINSHNPNDPQPYLTPSEMNFRLQQMVFISLMPDYKPANKIVLNYDLNYDFIPDLNSSITYVHRLKVTYGIPHLK